MSEIIYYGDCIDIMQSMQSESINMILADLPYGTTYAPWDSIIPLDKLWLAWKRIIKLLF